MNLYVGNISADSSEHQIRKMFERFGKVDKVTMNKPSDDLEAYSFCFLSMPFENQATRAIKELNGFSVKGKILNIKESALGVPNPETK